MSFSPAFLADGLRSRGWGIAGLGFPLSLPVSAPPPTVYEEDFYVALSNLPGNIFTILLMDSTGGKILLCESGSCTIPSHRVNTQKDALMFAQPVAFNLSRGFSAAACSLVVSSLSIFLIYVVQTQAQSLILSCIFSGVSVISWNSLNVLGTELYPTQLRYSFLKRSLIQSAGSVWTALSFFSGPPLSASSPEWAAWRPSRPTSSLGIWWTLTVLYRCCWCRFCC